MSESLARRRLFVRGAVQGVGFRPFVYRLAAAAGLRGFVNNGPAGVTIEVEGATDALDAFSIRLRSEAPPAAHVDEIRVEECPVSGDARFEIRDSDLAGSPTARVLPDLATCADCLSEVLDPANRRYRYPFTNCTNCGPRYTIVESLPYDRSRTTMRHFPMCADCEREYRDPANRRFHAEPTACPACGPRVSFLRPEGAALEEGEAALRRAATAVRDGRVLALKGLGGFQLLVLADDAAAVARLRDRKRREAKPFAVMFPDLDAIRTVCDVDEEEAALLGSAAAPIVILRRAREGDSLPFAPPVEAVAPGNPYLGAMLPCTPLHHLLLREIGAPVVATSGNLAEEPLAIDNDEARSRLSGIADVFLVHDRPIARPVDDSVARILAGEPQNLRLARGYSPCVLAVPFDLPESLAVGGHQKSTVALARGREILVSQHLGDLESAAARENFDRTIADLETLHGIAPVHVACDRHPDYPSTHRARRRGLPVHPVQHHEAHVLACLAEQARHVHPPLLAVAWDGTGYGHDETIWGGEFLRFDGAAFTRIGHLRTFPLPGGDAAVRDPRRSALGLCFELFGADLRSHLPPRLAASFPGRELDLLISMMRRGVRSPRCSSVGRLFDGVAALVGLAHRNRFEGDAAMALEFALAPPPDDPSVILPGAAPYPGPTDPIRDFAPLVDGILADAAAGVPVAAISARFHNTLVEWILAAARRVGDAHVALTGGCFQNHYLSEHAIRRLREDGFRPVWHRRLPPNDGALSAGQLYLSPGARVFQPGDGLSRRRTRGVPPAMR